MAPPTIERYRLQAPTEWNFHPDGPLAHWLRQTQPTPDRQRQARLAATALDPCVQLNVQGAAPLLRALELSRDATQNLALRTELNTVIDQVGDGAVAGLRPGLRGRAGLRTCSRQPGAH